MDNILQMGLEFILALQAIGDWLITPMKLFTFLGNEEFYLLLAPAVYWCFSAEIGLQLGLILMFSASTNAVFKLAFHQPRPSWLDPSLQPRVTEGSFGIPSGHAQNAVAVWGLLDIRTGRFWGWIIAVLLTLFIGLSRMALGVHFPTDVLAGWGLGLLTLWLFVKLTPPIRRWLKGLSAWQQAGVALIVSLALILAGYATRGLLGSWQVPPAWVENALAADPGSEPITPLDLSGLVSNGGALFGLASGAVFISRRGGYRAKGKPFQLILRYIMGVAGVFILWRGLGLVFPRGEELLPVMLRYLRYALIGFWITGLAPLVFRWTRLDAS